MRISFTGSLVCMAFIGAAVFGFLMMQGDAHHESGCFAATAQGFECPAKGNAFLVADFHMAGWKKIVARDAAGTLSLAALFLVVAAGAGRLFRSSPDFIAAPSAGFLARRIFPSFSLPIASRYLYRWLAVHEHSSPRA